MKTEALPYMSLLALFYGTGLVASRFGVGQFAPLTFVALRLSIASLCYIAIYGLSRRRVLPRDRRIWRHAPILGVLGTAVPMSLIIGSLQYQSSGMTALLLTIGPVITVVLAHFFLDDERLTRRTIIGVLVACSGAVLLIALGETGLPDVAEASPIGYLMVFAGMTVVSSMTIYVRRNMRDLDTFDTAAVRMWSAALFALPLSILLVGFNLSQVTPSGYAALLYTGLAVSFSGLLLEFHIIQRFGATAAAMTGNLIPIAAMIGGALLLGETITIGMVAGLVLIVSGVSIISRRDLAVAAPIEAD